MLRLEWLGLAILVTLTLVSGAPREAPRSTERVIACPSRSAHRPPIDVGPVASSITSDGEQNKLRDADRLYRAGAAGEAARSIRDYAAFGYPRPTPRATELLTLAELYAQFADAQAVLASASASPIDRFVALRRAQSLDLALGGAFADRLNAQMREVAPLAAEAYARAHDAAGASLAEHTATLFR